MGFTTITTHVILFFLVLAIFSSSAGIFRVHAESNSEIITTHRNGALDTLNTEAEITNVSFSQYPGKNVTSVLVKNTGNTIIHTDKIDVYINRIRLGRSPSNWTIALKEGYSGVLWEPQETYEINITGHFSEGFNTFQITTEYGKSAVGSLVVN